MTEREFWILFRRVLLMLARAIEKWQRINAEPIEKRLPAKVIHPSNSLDKAE